jgi:hypothetical protein
MAKESSASRARRSCFDVMGKESRCAGPHGKSQARKSRADFRKK